MSNIRSVCEMNNNVGVMPDKWQTSALMPIFKEKDVRNCNTNRTVILLQHAMKVVE